MDENKLVFLLRENEALIYSIAKKYDLYYSIDDLYQVGVIGLIKASKKYDENCNAKFSSYAYKYILGEIINFIKKDRNILVGDDAFSIYKSYLRIKELLENKYGKEVSLNDISSFMNIDVSKLVSIIESVSFTKTIESDEMFYFDNRDEIDTRILLNDEISLLSSFQRKIINYRYYQGFNQEQTASLLGTSQSSVSREEKLILSHMKNNLHI